LLASVANQHLVCDRNIRQPGFDLPCQTQTLLIRFHTGQGPCCACLHKWDLVTSDLCDCSREQTMNQIVDMCTSTKFNGGPTRLIVCSSLAKQYGDDSIRE